MGLPAWNKGKKWSEATIERIRIAKSNPSAETRQRLSVAKKGKSPWPTSPEERAAWAAKISAAKKGIPLGRPSWHSGKTGVYKPEIIEALRIARLGKPNAAVSAANKRRLGMKYNKAKPHLPPNI